MDNVVVELNAKEKLETDRLFGLLLKYENEFFGIRDLKIVDDGDGTLSGKTDFCVHFTINQDSLMFRKSSEENYDSYGYGTWIHWNYGLTGDVVRKKGDPIPTEGKELHLRLLRKFRTEMNETLGLVEHMCKKLGVED